MAPPASKKARQTKEGKRSSASALATIVRKRDKNAVAPISKLPAHILAEIFTIVASRNNFSPRPPMPPSNRWIRVTHVCHSWRETALSSPKVWSYFRATKNTECAKELLSRSGSTPLYLYFGDYRLNPEFLALTVENTHRTRSINASLSDALVKSWTKLSSEMPQLRDLSLHGFSMSGQLANLFGLCSMPELSRLDLSACVIPWNDSIFTQGSLTRLTVCHKERPTEGILVFADLIDVLRGTPSLEHLHLEHAIDSQPSVTQSVNTIELPCLSSLRLNDELASCLRLFRQIAFPQTAEITLECSEVDEAGAKALGEEIVAQIEVDDGNTDEDRKSFLGVGIALTYQKTRIQAYSCDVTVHELSGEVHFPQGRRSWVDVTLHDDYQSRYCYAFCDPLPLSSVKTLHVETKNCSTDLSAVVKGMSGVRSFGIQPAERDDMVRIPKLLSLQTGNGPTANQLLLPSLVDLYLFGVVFRPVDFIPDDRIFSTYCKMFSDRSVAGKKIQKLELHHPTNIFKEDAEKLKGAVGEVTWDPNDVEYDPEIDDYLAVEDYPLDDDYFRDGAFDGEPCDGFFYFG